MLRILILALALGALLTQITTIPAVAVAAASFGVLIAAAAIVAVCSMAGSAVKYHAQLA